MQIFFSPQRGDDELTVSKSGDVLTINSEVFDFSALPDGATIKAGMVPCEWIVGPVERIEGELHLTLILPLGPNPSEALALQKVISNPPDGAVAIPFDPPAETEELANVET